MTGTSPNLASSDTATDAAAEISRIEHHLRGLLRQCQLDGDVRPLLRIITAPGPEAMAAWRQWRKDHMIADASPRQWRLLSAVGRKLLDSEIDPDDQNALAAIKREIWRDNQLRVRLNAPVLQSLHDAGIPFMVLKGGARMACEAGAMETRYARDIDILLPPEHLTDGIDVLIGMGLRSVTGHLPGKVKSRAFARLHPPGQRGLGYVEIDVHSGLLNFGRRAHLERELWLRRMPGTLGGVPVAVPSPADRFVHAIAHGLLADVDAPADWIVDAFAALRDPAFRPEIVVEEIKKRRVGVPLAIGCLFLRRDLDVTVPRDVMEACTQDVSSLIYRMEMNSFLKPHRKRTPVDRLFAALAERQRTRGREPAARMRNTSWLFKPSLRAPELNWVPFQDGRAKLTLPPHSGKNGGQLRIFLQCPNEALGRHSFDVVLDGVWIGRARLRMAQLLKVMPHRALCTTLSYQLPSNRAKTDGETLQIVALDDKAPSADPLPGLRAGAMVER